MRQRTLDNGYTVKMDVIPHHGFVYEGFCAYSVWVIYPNKRTKLRSYHSSRVAADFKFLQQVENHIVI